MVAKTTVYKLYLLDLTAGLEIEMLPIALYSNYDQASKLWRSIEPILG